ncbi:unnamed protein product [Rotaria sp. Silwood1]|nr:unnamed protein product [Rotaria sp. Silwood1]
MDVEKSIFAIASISKTFIAVAVMQLVEQELVDLDTDINQYLSEPHHRIFHPNYSSHSITLRRLLSHSSSIAVDENIQLSLYQTGDTAFEQSTLAETLFTYVNPNTSNWLPKPPGTVTFYSNDGSSLAGLVVERVANMSFDEYVKEKIMKPLNVDISKVGVRLADFSNREELVKHYAYSFNASNLNEWTQGLPQLNVTQLSSTFPSWLYIPFFGFSAYPAGLFRMSARSLSIFLQMFMNNGSGLLNPRSIAEMRLIVGGGLIPYYDPNGIASSSVIPPPSFGLSWIWQTLSDGRRYIGHSGSLPGARHSMLVNEKNTIGVIVLSNGDSNVPLQNQQDSYIIVDGINWFYYWDIETLRFGLNYQARSDDLFIVTYPKSGTTWMKTIVYTLLTNGQPFDIDCKDFFERFPYLELDDEKAIINMRRPGALRSHLPMNRIPYNSQAKYICVIRNPNDVCVSYYTFYNTWGGVHRLNFDEFFELFIQGRLPFNDYFECLRLTWERRNDPNVLLVATFINIHLTEELLQKVILYSSFNYMKNKYDDERRKFEMIYIEEIEDEIARARMLKQFDGDPNMELVRKGQINDWKTFMSLEQSERIKNKFIETCQKCDGLESYWSKWNIFC